MNIKYLLLGVATVAICGIGFIFFKSENNLLKNHPAEKISKNEKKGIKGATKWLSDRRVNQKTGRIDIADISKALAQVKSLKNSSKSFDLQWSELGPDNIGGRTRTILIDKDDPNLIFAGSVSGGLWKSSTGGSSWQQVMYSGDANATGIDGNDIIANLIISSMCQAANGDIYFGTGESYVGYINGQKSSGFDGQGIWKSTDRGMTFSKLASTWDNATSQGIFRFVNKIAVDPVNAQKIYAATYKGLMVSENGGTTWANYISAEADHEAEDVKVGKKNGVVVVSMINGDHLIGSENYIYVSSDGSNGSFVKHSIDGYSGRQELAVSPEDDNYMYCLKAKPYGAGTRGIYKSTDKGVTWTNIGPQGTGFNILGEQGYYDNVIAVYPNNKDQIICGGQANLYFYSSLYGWHAISQWQNSQDNSYVHSDHHAITFHPTNPNILYIGSDGGISKSSDGGFSYVTLNKNYNVTQFYAVGFSGDGRVIGGTQDNGTLYTDYTGNTSKTFIPVHGGDGGYSEMSTLKPKVTFATMYGGWLGRSETPGSSIENEYGPVTGDAVAPFVTSIALWESYNDSLSADSVNFKADRNYSAGEMIHAKSKMNLRDLTYTLAAPLLKDSSIKVQDKFQSVLAIGLYNRVWITRKSLDFTVNPAPWYPISKKTPTIGLVNTLAFSKDGNYLYFATDTCLYRCSNLNYSRSKAQMYADTTVAGVCKIITQKIASFKAIGGFITSIAVDPANSENVVVTLGGYSNTGGKVWYSTNAATSTTLTGNFVSKDNFVFPVYSSLLLWNDGKKVVIGSEYGMYSTDDITASTPVWNDQNNTMGNVPVFMVRQQIIPNTYITGVTNHGVIYAATHGRGLWKSESNKGPVGIEESQIAPIAISNIMVYPNPAHLNAHVALELSKASDVTLNVYDLQGKLVKTLTMRNQGEGKHSYPINISELGKGNYILNVISGNNKLTTKFLVY